MRTALPLVCGCLLSTCTTFEGGLFHKPGVSYRVAAPDASAWRKVSLGDNDLAWVARGSGETLAVNATCEDHGDPSLEVLTNHLLLGFTAREQLAQTPFRLDGREALRSRYRALLDGVPVELELVVLKKNGCVHDFTLVAPGGQPAAHRAALEALLDGFRQEASP
jgi:hypothetical protein